MSILHAAETTVPWRPASAPAPYRPGDRVALTSPEGVRFLVRVEAITPTETGCFMVHGAVVSPRRFRSHLVSTLVDAQGVGPSVQAAP